jgi:hypothetical protein
MSRPTTWTWTPWSGWRVRRPPGLPAEHPIPCTCACCP